MFFRSLHMKEIMHRIYMNIRSCFRQDDGILMDTVSKICLVSLVMEEDRYSKNIACWWSYRVGTVIPNDVFSGSMVGNIACHKGILKGYS